MKIRKTLPVAALLAWVAVSGCAHSVSRSDAVFQTSTITALLEGSFDGETTFRELEGHGDFGIGTLDSLDGEMIGLDGRFYQIRSDGRVYSVDDSARTPFAVVKFFRPDRTLVLDRAMSCRQMEEYLDEAVHSKNIFYAFRIDGAFSYVKARSVPAQKKPYPRLAEAAKQQSVFEFHNVEGTLAGFRSPEQAAGLNVPGYHFHFLSSDGGEGGHLLSCEVLKARIAIDSSREFDLVIPEKGDFEDVKSPAVRRSELDRIEK